MNIIDEILKFVGELVLYGGGLVAIAFLVFTFLGKSLIESWFLKNYKHYEYQINSLFNRVTKIHEKEFEVLPEAWKRLQDALGALTRLAQPLQSSDQDISNDIGFKEHLDTREKLFKHNVDETQECVNKFNNYISYHKIFLSSDLFHEFAFVDHLLYLSTHKAKAEGINSWEELRKLRDEAQKTATKIELLIQKRLHYSDAV